MGLCASKPYKTRNYMLDMERRRLIYGLNCETVEQFWLSDEFKTFVEEYYQKHPESDLVLTGKVVCNEYIDTWNIWKRKQESHINNPDMPYPDRFESVYFPDMFNELLQIEFPYPSIYDSICDFCQPRIPKKHSPKQFNSILKLYQTPVAYRNYLKNAKRKFPTLEIYVNSLLDYNEYHQLKKQLINIYGKTVWDASQLEKNPNEGLLMTNNKILI